MVELVLLSAIGVIILFTGMTILMNTAFQIIDLFTFFTIIVGYVLLILTYRKRMQLQTAKLVIYQGYEIYLYYGSMLFFTICCLTVYLDVINLESMVTPLMLGWIGPLTGYLCYHSLLVFYQKEFCLSGEMIRYKDVKSLEVFHYNKDKKKILLRVKGKEMIYTGRNETVLKAKENFLHFCHCKEVKEKL